MLVWPIPPFPGVLGSGMSLSFLYHLPCLIVGFSFASLLAAPVPPSCTPCSCIVECLSHLILSAWLICHCSMSSFADSSLLILFSPSCDGASDVLTLCARCNSLVSLVPFVFRVGFKAAFVFGDLCLRTSLGMYFASMVYVGVIPCYIFCNHLFCPSPFVPCLPASFYVCKPSVGVGTFLWLVTCAACLSPLIDDPALRGRRFRS